MHFFFSFHTIFWFQNLILEKIQIWYEISMSCLTKQMRWTVVGYVTCDCIHHHIRLICNSSIWFFFIFIYLFFLSFFSLPWIGDLPIPSTCLFSFDFPCPGFLHSKNKNTHSPYQQSTQIAQGLTLLSRAAAPTTGPAQLQRRSWNESIAEKQKTRVSFKCCVWQILRLLFFTRLLTHQNACPKRPIVFFPIETLNALNGTRSIIEFLIFFLSFNWWSCFSFFCFSPSPIFSCLPTLTRVRIPLSKPIWFSKFWG